MTLYRFKQLTAEATHISENSCSFIPTNQTLLGILEYIQLYMQNGITKYFTQNTKYITQNST